MPIVSIQKNLTDLSHLLSQLSTDDYTCQYLELSKATIGEHTRHIIELFQCLENQYESGIINYDSRKRDYTIQNCTETAKTAIECIIENLKKPNKNLILQQVIGNQILEIESNYTRELLYNLEHSIHHQALIKVAILQNDSITIDENFGVAHSTIEYRKKCAQ